MAANDFDFVFGTWHVHNRKLRDVLDPACDDWVEFPARARAEPVFDGLAHVDRYWAEASPVAAAFEGLTLRQWDPKAELWRIWWSSSRNPGHLDPPMEGTWTDGVGTFLGHDTIAGTPTEVRFIWTNPTPSTARWEQAFSTDTGATWRTNWTMDLTRPPA
jgi:hypothetical protein